MEHDPWTIDPFFDSLSIFDDQLPSVSFGTVDGTVEAATSRDAIEYSPEGQSHYSRARDNSLQPSDLQPGRSQQPAAFPHTESASRHDKILETASQPSAQEDLGVTASWSDHQQFLPAELHEYGSLHFEVLQLAHKSKLHEPWKHDPDKPQNRTELASDPLSWWGTTLRTLQTASQGKTKNGDSTWKRADDGHWYRRKYPACRISNMTMKASDNLPRIKVKDAERARQKTNHITLPGRKRRAQRTETSQDLLRPIGSTLNQVHDAESRTRAHDVAEPVIPNKTLVLRWKAMLEDERDDTLSNFRCGCGRVVEHEGACSQLFENATDYVRCRYKWNDKTGERLLVSAETDCTGELKEYCGACSLLLDTRLIRTCCGRHNILTAFELSSLGNGTVIGGRRRIELLLRMFKMKEQHDGNPRDLQDLRCQSCQIPLKIRDVWDHDIYPVQHYPRPFDCIACFYDYNRYDGEKYLRFTKMHVEDDAITTSIPGRFRCIACTKSLEQHIRHQLPGADFLGAACREKNINYCRCENGGCECGFQDKA